MPRGTNLSQDAEMRQIRRGLVGGMTFICLALFLLGPIGATTEPLDGYWWNGQTEQIKILYVRVFMEATESLLVSLEELDNGAKRRAQGFTIYSENEWLELLECIKGYSDLGPFSIREILDGLDQFYEDFRNKRIWVYRAVEVIRMQLLEDSEGLIKKKISDLRKAARESNGG